MPTYAQTPRDLRRLRPMRVVDRRRQGGRDRQQIAQQRGVAARRETSAKIRRCDDDCARMAMAMPATCRFGWRFPQSYRRNGATTAGWRLTSVTDAAMVVRWMEAFHAQKCSASETPPSAATAKRRQVDVANLATLP